MFLRSRLLPRVEAAVLKTSQRSSADVSVQQLSSRGQKAIRNMREDSFRNLHPITFAGRLGYACWITNIGQNRPRGAQAVFEGSEAGVVTIRAAEIKFLQSVVFC